MNRAILFTRTWDPRLASWSWRARTARSSRPRSRRPRRINDREDLMPSFDVVSELNKHELANAVDQAIRELSTRFDFKDTGATIELLEKTVTLKAQVEFQLKQ